jgi:hypothetical protein
MGPRCLHHYYCTIVSMLLFIRIAACGASMACSTQATCLEGRSNGSSEAIHRKRALGFQWLTSTNLSEYVSNEKFVLSVAHMPCESSLLQKGCVIAYSKGQCVQQTFCLFYAFGEACSTVESKSRPVTTSFCLPHSGGKENAGYLERFLFSYHCLMQ